MRRIRRHLGITKAEFDANILAMRKWTSTELLDAGFNPSAVSGRQGHTVQVMLTNYSSRRSSADHAAADPLGGGQESPHSVASDRARQRHRVLTPPDTESRFVALPSCGIGWAACGLPVE